MKPFSPVVIYTFLFDVIWPSDRKLPVALKSTTWSIKRSLVSLLVHLSLSGVWWQSYSVPDQVLLGFCSDSQRGLVGDHQPPFS